MFRHNWGWQGLFVRYEECTWLSANDVRSARGRGGRAFAAVG